MGAQPPICERKKNLSFVIINSAQHVFTFTRAAKHHPTTRSSSPTSFSLLAFVHSWGHAVSLAAQVQTKPSWIPFVPVNHASDISGRDSRNPAELSANRRNTVGSGNKDQIIICSVYRKTAAISSQIMILTILGGQTIFIACLLRLIFLSCLTQLEVEGGERERQRSRKTDESRMKERRRESVCVVSQHDTVFSCVYACVCLC